MPVSCCSRTWVTLLSRVAAEAPGIAGADIDHVGATSGYWATGSVSDRADAREHDDDRDHPREDRAIDEDLRHALAAAPFGVHLFQTSGRRRLDPLRCDRRTGLIGAPSLRFAVP